MPTYRFKCTECGNEWVEEMSIKEYEDRVNDIKCPICNSNLIERVYGKNLQVIYKSTGFYTTNRMLDDADPGLGKEYD